MTQGEPAPAPRLMLTDPKRTLGEKSAVSAVTARARQASEGAPTPSQAPKTLYPSENFSAICEEAIILSPSQMRKLRPREVQQQ